MPKKQAGENTKKAAGNAQKAESAANKKAAENAKKSAAEAQEWGKGAKDSSKAEAAASKAAEAARKKAEKDALLKEEEASLPTKPANKGKTAPPKASRGLNLGAIDSLDPTIPAKPTALNATGIDNALDALSLTSAPSTQALDRHPERRFKAAYAAFEERRLDEMKDEKGLRRNQKVEQIRKEFEKHPENPFNQVGGRYDMSKEEMKEVKEQMRAEVEGRLGGE
nr:hypothetical protein B0A51_07007 [Rachicladosporium sp. CCFEE 5018]